MTAQIIIMIILITIKLTIMIIITITIITLMIIIIMMIIIVIITISTSNEHLRTALGWHHLSNAESTNLGLESLNSLESRQNLVWRVNKLGLESQHISFWRA